MQNIKETYYSYCCNYRQTLLVLYILERNCKKIVTKLF